MRLQSTVFALLTLSTIALLVGPAAVAAGSWTLIGWNDLGMHCLDGDYSIYAILPPYNNIHAQLIDSNGRLVKSPGGVTVTYSAVADADGSINSISAPKTNFWQFMNSLFGVSLPPDAGLAGNAMPGAGEAAMKFDPATNWFIAEGVPITPYDDAGNKNYYPMMRLTTRDSSGAVLAATDVVLPVSDEMDCSACHASGARSETQPAGGWASHPLLIKDYKLNILKLHDERQSGNQAYAAALAASGYSSAGLFATAVNGKPVLCAACHASNALGAAGQPGVAPLTESIHSYHAHATDPATGLPLNDDQNRSACYRCHPGSETRCLRGAMGDAVAANGTMAIQCQNCHGSMNAVGSQRQGWLDEPNCQACHTGTATRNSGQIRFTSALDSSGRLRAPADNRFATNPNTPAPGISLYRFSRGHGGLQCETCHGSTHAEFPSSHASDNVQSTRIQGHPGVLAECGVCHAAPLTTTGGPHGLHTTGQAWVQAHANVAERGTSGCAECHGTDFRGTVLSRTTADRTLSTRFGTKQFWRGFQVGCYACHRGPNTDSANSNRAPVVNNASASTVVGQSATIQLSVTDADGNATTLRVVSQPAHGTVTLAGAAATYTPYAGWEGTDTFTYAAWDGSVDSNLGSVSVTVAAAQRPSFPPEGVVNAASYQGGGIAPGEMVAIFGTGMGPASPAWVQLNSAGLVTRSLAGTRVLFDGMPAPLIYTSANQLVAMVPYGVAGKSASQVQVEYAGILSSAVSVPVLPSVPGLFAADASGSGQGAFLNQDGITRNSAASPAPKGSVAVLYATGEGRIDANVFDGQLLSIPLPAPVSKVAVQIDGIDAPVEYAGSVATQVAGFMQVNVRIPEGVRSGAVPVRLFVGGVPSKDGVTLAVK